MKMNKKLIFFMLLSCFYPIAMCYRPDLVPVEKETEVTFRLVVVFCLYNYLTCLFMLT